MWRYWDAPATLREVSTLPSPSRHVRTAGTVACVLARDARHRLPARAASPAVPPALSRPPVRQALESTPTSPDSTTVPSKFVEGEEVFSHAKDGKYYLGTVVEVRLVGPRGRQPVCALRFRIALIFIFDYFVDT